ncbi:hypothetical protein FRB97_002405, partial [Tulasnella sp. 331]
RWGDTRRKTDEVSKTLLTNNVTVNSAYITYASWALSLTIKGSRIFQGESPDAPHLPLGNEVDVWAAREGNSFADKLLDVLDAFSQYYANARRATPSRHIYSRLLGCQRQLLVHAKSLNLSDGMALQESSPRPDALFKKIHRALNANIWEVLRIQANPEVLHPPIDSLALQDCLHTLVDYLRELLLTPGAQWSEVDPSTLRITALHGRDPVLAPKHAELAEAVLYRYFVHRSLYSGLGAGPIRDERRLKLSRDRRIGSALISALRLYLGLFPSTTHANTWPIFGSYLLFLATGCLQTGDPSVCVIDLILNVTDILPRGRARMTAAHGNSDAFPTPSLSAGLDFRRRLPRINMPSLHVALDDEDDGWVEAKVEKTVVEACRGWDLTNSTLMGSCMIWLAESFRHKEAWATKVDGKGVIQLFVAIMQKKRDPQADAELAVMQKKTNPIQDFQVDTELWSSVDAVSAGALFLRAWRTDLEAAKKVIEADSDPTVAEWPGWTHTATIEAFAAWLPTLDNSGKIAIKENDDDMSMLQTTVELDLITSFIDEASRKNLKAVERCGLDLTCRRIRAEMEIMDKNIKVHMRERGLASTLNSPVSIPEPSRRPTNLRRVAFPAMLPMVTVPFTPTRPLDPPLQNDLVSTPTPKSHPALQESVPTPWEAIRSGMSCCLIGTGKRRSAEMWKIRGEAEVDNPEGANAAWLDTFLDALPSGKTLPRPTSSNVVDTQWTSFTWSSPDDLYFFYNAWLQSRPAQYNSWRVVPYAGSRPQAGHRIQAVAEYAP